MFTKDKIKQKRIEKNISKYCPENPITQLMAAKYRELENLKQRI